MKNYSLLYALLLFSAFALTSCSGTKSAVGDTAAAATNTANKVKKRKAPKKSEIDLTNWKVTIPTARPDGKAMSVEPPEIFDYANVDALKEFMYDDPKDGALVFHAYPESTTANTKYSRTELREQMESGSNHRNWTFKEGGYMKVKMSVPEVSKDEKGKYHRVIVAQIHGRLTDAQRDLIGQKDNNAPPILKIYWDRGKIRVKTKVLKDTSAPDEEILDKKAWGDDEGYNFDIPVDKSKFTLEVKVSDGRMEVILNGFQKAVYKGVDIERWGIFENYFKVGNYFQSRDEGSYGKVKIYELEVSH